MDTLKDKKFLVMGGTLGAVVGALCAVSSLTIAIYSPIVNEKYQSFRLEEERIEATKAGLDYLSAQIRPQAQLDLESALHELQNSPTYTKGQETKAYYDTLFVTLAAAGLASTLVGGLLLGYAVISSTNRKDTSPHFLD